MSHSKAAVVQVAGLVKDRAGSQRGARLVILAPLPEAEAENEADAIAADDSSGQCPNNHEHSLQATHANEVLKFALVLEGKYSHTSTS